MHSLPARLSALLVFVSLLVACDGEIGGHDHHSDGTEEELSIHVTTETVGDFERGTCSTSSVAALSRQIAEEMTCMAPGVVVELLPGNGLTFASSAVLPFMEAEAAQNLRDAAAEQPIRLNSGFRTVVQQYLLRRWRDRGRCGISAAAPPGRSNHESARAIDVSNPSSVRATLRRHGWHDPLPFDRVHFEHLASPDMRGLDVHAFQRLWNRNNPGDRISEDGDYGPATAARIRRAPAAGFPLGPSCTGNGSANWVGDSCEDDAGCELPADNGSCETWTEAGSNDISGMCTSGCTGTCPQRSGETPSVCAAAGPGEGTCLPSAQEGCASGVAKPLPRFSMNSTSQVQTVCVSPAVEGIGCTTNLGEGECMDTDLSSCTGELVSGACPGANSIRCCVPDQVEEEEEEAAVSCSFLGNEGECIDVNTQSCGGQVVTGVCPGASNVRCCLL